MFGIMSEFVDAAERLSNIEPAVSMFGSARTAVDHPYYKLAEQIARQLSDAGFTVISGGGPGMMEAFNKGAYFGKSPAVGLNIELPREQFGNSIRVERQGEWEHHVRRPLSQQQDVRRCYAQQIL